MNYFDIIFLVLFIWSAYRGIKKGFIVMAASLAALILGIWGAVRFSYFTFNFLSTHFELKTQYLSLIAFAITFVVIVIIVHLIARLIEKLVEAVALGFLNKIAGLLFGLIKTAFILSVVLVIINTIDEKLPFIPEEHKNNSLLYKPLSKLVPAIFPYLKFENLKKNILEEEDKTGTEVEV
jgi:membrane protein required for colicin V production